MPGHAIIDGIRKDPAICGVYSLSLAELPGMLLPNNFIALSNPIGSGKFLVAGGIFVSSVAIGTTVVTAPMRGFRCAAASGGTLISSSDVVKYDSRYPPPAAQLRKDNPTAATEGAFFNSPAPINQGAAAGQFFHSIEPPPASGGFILFPGEGIVLRTSLGDIDQLWNITIVWGEGSISV